MERRLSTHTISAFSGRGFKEYLLTDAAGNYRLFTPMTEG
jgi:hypothetical protein